MHIASVYGCFLLEAEKVTLLSMQILRTAVAYKTLSIFIFHMLSAFRTLDVLN